MDRPTILIVKLSAIGDVVHTLPALNALRRYYPKAHISWLVEEAAADLIKNHPALDRVLVSRRKTWLKGLGSAQWRLHVLEMKAFVRSLRDRHYDMVFDFQAALKGAALIALVRGRRKIGFGRGLQHQEGSYVVLNERIPAVSMEIHALERGLIMLKAAGVPCPTIEYRLPIAADHRLKANQVLSGKGIGSDQAFVAINPMAKWESKLWQQDKFARLADWVQTEFSLPVVFTGGPEDQAYINAIEGQMKTESANLSGQTDLMTLAALLQRATLMISTDTGPMHIAAAVGTPTVALFGPTAPWRTGPYGQGHRVVQAVRDCQPCFKRRCPYPENCMASI
ncbi:MAG: glycosyltransferase family 9 protein, partial [Desulfatitalea sp.]